MDDEKDLLRLSYVSTLHIMDLVEMERSGGNSIVKLNLLPRGLKNFM